MDDVKVIDLNDFPAGMLSKLMHESDATAEHLFELSSGLFASFLRFPPNGRVPMHTHEGAHILWVVRGNGWVTTPNENFALAPGCIYVVPALEPHEVAAGEIGLDLLVVGDTYFPEDSSERLQLMEVVDD